MGGRHIVTCALLVPFMIWFLVNISTQWVIKIFGDGKGAGVHKNAQKPDMKLRT
jgi:hypothetical protein